MNIEQGSKCDTVHDIMHCIENRQPPSALLKTGLFLDVYILRVCMHMSIQTYLNNFGSSYKHVRCVLQHKSMREIAVTCTHTTYFDHEGEISYGG